MCLASHPVLGGPFRLSLRHRGVGERGEPVEGLELLLPAFEESSLVLLRVVVCRHGADRLQPRHVLVREGPRGRPLVCVPCETESRGRHVVLQALAVACEPIGVRLEVAEGRRRLVIWVSAHAVSSSNARSFSLAGAVARSKRASSSVRPAVRRTGAWWSWYSPTACRAPQAVPRRCSRSGAVR